MTLNKIHRNIKKKYFMIIDLLPYNQSFITDIKSFLTEKNHFLLTEKRRASHWLKLLKFSSDSDSESNYPDYLSLTVTIHLEIILKIALR